jgi:NAD(P)-dependent dehydrogenase (short-subunit alcohol dehydrogenase family)
MSGTLSGKVALVAGATRGAGRAIALSLGERGATVYCTGRSSRATRSPDFDAEAAARARRAAQAGATSRDEVSRDAFALAGRPETIEETAEGVTARGGHGVAVRTDHTRPAEVEALVARIRAEQGRLHLLVNDVWGGDELTEWGRPPWELSLEPALALLERAVHSHLITARLALPLMLERGADTAQGERPPGLVIEVTDGEGLFYRGQLVYDLAKFAVIRLAFALAEELRPRGIAALALTPGFLRSEAMLEHFGVTEANWREAVAAESHFAHSETPFYVGRAVAALAADPAVLAKSGGVYSSWGLQAEYGYTDADGSTPHWGRYAAGASFSAEQRASAARFLAAFGAAFLPD